jgi:hypothetical protein
MTDILRLRKRLCLEIAEAIATHFRLCRTDYDTDMAARLINAHLPLTRDESLLEYEQLSGQAVVPPPAPAAPSRWGLVRRALGYGKEIPMSGILDGVLERLGELDRLRAAIRAHRDQQGDDRCHLDDYELYRALGEPIPEHACRLNDPAVMRADCDRYIAYRHDPAKEYLSPQREIDRLTAENADLRQRLEAAYHRIGQQSDQLSRNVERKGTVT